jgi:hypothetical protein
MRRIGSSLLLLLLLCTAPISARSQTPGATPNAAKPQQDSIPQIKLGESSVELVGPWRFHPGDDMAWAQPSFDDSGWDTMDLTPPPGSSDPSVGVSGYVPGWTARGYTGHSGFAWYRLQIDVEGASRRLALKMPDSADDAYQVFVNGQQIGEFGKFSDHSVIAYSTLPQAYRLPKGVANGRMTIAIRMWMDSATPFNSPDAGGMHAPPILGYAPVMAALVKLDYYDTAHDVGSGFLELLILLMALVMAVALDWLDHSEKAYLWLAFVCLVTLLGNSIVLLVNFTESIGQTMAVVLSDVILAPLRIGLWVLFWGYWFRIVRIGLLHRIVWPLVGLLMIGTAMLRPPLYGQQVPVHYASVIVPLLLIVKLLLGALLFAVAYQGFKKQKTEGWLAGIAVLLVFIANYQHELRLIHIKTTFSVFDFAISLGTLATILSLLIITVMLLRRFINAQRLKEQWKLEIQQAKHVQQVLIPEKLPAVQGLKIESEYRPAREVGGDFFQILPGQVTGSALIVVGDVTGKGLQAGMLVALIVGAIRSAAQHTSDPAEVLRAINDQLCEREHASATCLIMRIDPDGTVILANSGQLPPFFNGKEIEMEGSLPLGVIPDVDFSLSTFRLKPGDSLVLMSDGVIEAQDSQGTLFGFERVDEMLRTASTTPDDIATAAQRFGQEDDILVLRVQRSAAQTVETAAEPQYA